ncbi:MAG: LuxR C-terminal-related transcriptional regulator [Anaerolineae bacterium]|nr:LuxR C-terminal-related transcriptional regulator [Anaerolineae bacterium]
MQAFPRTKFIPPLAQRDLFPRVGLLSWVQRELPLSRLVLLSAPAGYGKTTLLSALPAILPDYALAWLALEPDDNDPARFLNALGEALAGVHPQLKTVILENSAALFAPGGGNLPVFALRQVMTALVNALLALSVPPCILVLDDLHEIKHPAIYEMLDYLLEQQPPQLHLAVSSRLTPPLQLNRLRARRQLAELNMADLSFNADESRLFTNEVLKLGLSERDLDALQQKTEGWPVGLVLLTNRLRVLQPSGERMTFLNQLKQIEPGTFFYLADEVLNQQPPYLRDFLLHTSILAELNPDLCRELSGQTDAAGLLEELFERNLFLSRTLNGDEPLYRYHALFAGFLQATLRRQDLPAYRALHRRAASLENDPARKISHWLEAQGWQQAAEQIEAVGLLYLEQGFQETLAAWMGALPEDLIKGRYRLLYLQGITHLLSGELTSSRSALQAALVLPPERQAPELQTRLLSSLASLAFMRADFAESAALIKRAENNLQTEPAPVEFLMLRTSLALFHEADLPRAASELQTTLARVQASTDLQQWYLLAIYLGTEFTVLPGALEALEDFCAAARTHYGSHINPLRLGVEDLWAGIHLRRGRLKQAVETGRSALRIKDQLGGYPFLGVNAALAVALACTGRGEYAAAETAINFVQQQAQQAELNMVLTAGGLYPLGKLRWLEGRLSETQQVYQLMCELPQRLPLTESLQKMLGALLEISARHYSAAETLLMETVEQQKREGISEVYSSARLLLAYMYERWEKPQEALRHFDNVLSSHEETPGTILQDAPLAAPLLKLAVRQGLRARQAAALLRQMGLPADTETSPNGLLTERQLEILRLITAGYSNQAIADHLVLSLATVKSHVVHIMDRLGATSRSEAVALARRKGLL